MIDHLSVEQLRSFIAIVDEGTFSAAGRRLGRVQSAVSQSIATAEKQLGVKLFDRSRRLPRLSPEGAVLVEQARRVLAELDGLYAHARHIRAGLEAEVSLVCDTIVPVTALVELGRRLLEDYPRVPVRIGTETLAAVSDRVEAGDYDLGLVGPGAGMSTDLERIAVGSVRMIPVAAPQHPLARIEGPVPAQELRRHVQLVLASRSDATRPDIAVVADRTWRLLDLHTKHAMLRAGLGWGNLPEPRVAADLGEGLLVRLHPASWSADEHLLSLAVVHRRDRPPGPIGRWIIEILPGLCHPAPSIASGDR